MLAPEIVALIQQALWLVLLLSAPPVLAATAVGLFVAVVQSATQIQEQTLQYAVKFVVVVLTIFVTASFLAGSLYQFGNEIFTQFPGLVRR